MCKVYLTSITCTQRFFNAKAVVGKTMMMICISLKRLHTMKIAAGETFNIFIL